MNPYLFKKPLWLSSQPLSPNVFSPISRFQECSMNAKNSYAGTWVIDHIDPNFRYENQGKPVEVADPILIRHASTSHYLASDNVLIQNDFGKEYEVYVNSFATKNRS
jgi:hypothetical protein